MSQDIVADTLNRIMNIKRAKKVSLVTEKYSKLLLNVLEIMKREGYVDYAVEDGKLKITVKELSECRAIKPRYNVSVDKIEKYMRRFLPSRNLGHIIISTSNGLKTHKEAIENKMGGSLIAYFY